MKTLATGIAAAIVLAAMSSSPALAGGPQHSVAFGTPTSCAPNAIRCSQGSRQGHVRCYSVAVQQNGTVVKRRVCRPYY